jgi:hypothetical protein
MGRMVVDQRCDILQDHLKTKLVDHVDDGVTETP